MKNFLRILPVLIFLFSSCDKSNVENEILVKSGQVHVKYIDNNGNPLSNIIVKLEQSGTVNAITMEMVPSEVMFEMKTNIDGVVDFGDINEGFYGLTTTATIDDIKYTSRENVEVVEGVKKELLIKPQESLGEINLSFNFYYMPKDTELKVILIDDEIIYDGELSEIINKADYNGIVTDDSEISFTVPAYRSFSLYSYVNVESDKYYPHTRLNVSKGYKKNLRFSVLSEYYGI